MSKKRAPQAELNHNIRLFIDPSNMVVLRAADGQTFLVDKNCAMVSKRFREWFLDLEAAVLSSGVQGPSATLRRASPDPSSSSGPFHTPPASHAQNVDPGLVIPFYDLEWETRPEHSNRGEAFFTVQQLIDYHNQIPSAEKLPSVEPQKGTARVPSPSSAGTRRSLVSCIHDETTGIRWYPMYDFSDVKGSMVDVGIRFMYLKYRQDCEPEKRLTFQTSLLGECNAVQLLSISAIMGL